MMDGGQKGQPLLGALPTTIEMALQPSNESRVITEPVEPFRIVHVNDLWCHVCGFDSEEVLGQTCKVLQGPGSCKATLTMLKQALNFKRNFAVQLLNYTKQGRPFMNTLQVTPLVDRDGKVTHYLGVVIARYLDGAGCVSPSIQLHSEPSHALVQREADSIRTSEAREGARAMRSAGERDSDPLSFGQSGMGLAHQSSGMLTAMDSLDSMRDDDGSAGRVPPFLTKLCEILTVESSDVVTFNPEASSFRINNPTTFAKEVRRRGVPLDTHPPLHPLSAHTPPPCRNPSPLLSIPPDHPHPTPTSSASLPILPKPTSLRQTLRAGLAALLQAQQARLLFAAAAHVWLSTEGECLVA